MSIVKHKKIILFLFALFLFFGIIQIQSTEAVTKLIGQSASITVTCSDPNGNLSQCNITSPITKNCPASGFSGSCSGTFTCSAVGTYNVCGQAVDEKGLTDSKCLDTVVCIVDQPPTGWISVGPDPVKEGEPITVAMSGDDDLGVSTLEWIEGGQVKACGGALSCSEIWGPYTAPSPPGDYTYTGRITDTAGQVTNVSDTFTVMPVFSLLCGGSEECTGRYVVVAEGVTSCSIDCGVGTSRSLASHDCNNPLNYCYDWCYHPGDSPPYYRGYDPECMLVVCNCECYVDGGQLAECTPGALNDQRACSPAFMSGNCNAGMCTTPTPQSNTFTVGTCSVKLTAKGWDCGDGIPCNNDVRYFHVNKGTDFLTVTMDDALSGIADLDLAFKNSWSIAGIYNDQLTITTTILDKNAAHTLDAGFDITTDTPGCFFDAPTCSGGWTGIDVVRDAGSGSRTYDIEFCGDGEINCGENCEPPGGRDPVRRALLCATDCLSQTCDLDLVNENVTIDFNCVLSIKEHWLQNGNLTITTGGTLQLNSGVSLRIDSGRNISLLEGQIIMNGGIIYVGP